MAVGEEEEEGGGELKRTAAVAAERNEINKGLTTNSKPTSHELPPPSCLLRIHPTTTCDDRFLFVVIPVIWMRPQCAA